MRVQFTTASPADPRGSGIAPLPRVRQLSTKGAQQAEPLPVDLPPCCSTRARRVPPLSIIQAPFQEQLRDILLSEHLRPATSAPPPSLTMLPLSQARRAAGPKSTEESQTVLPFSPRARP